MPDAFTAAQQSAIEAEVPKLMGYGLTEREARSAAENKARGLEFAANPPRVHGKQANRDIASIEAVSDDPGGALDQVLRLRPLTVAEVRASRAPRWLVRMLLQQRGIVLVWGASGSGKTFVVFDMACSTARRIPWMGRRVSAAVRGVIYVAGEGHLKHRIEAYMQAHELSDEDLARMRFVTTTVNLFDEGADLMPLIAQIRDASRSLGGVSLIVLDTLNAMMAGGDENSSEDMGRMISAARLLVAQFDCALVYVHHCGKDESNGARGHSSLRAAVDTELVVRDRGAHRTITLEKQRDGETGAEFAFKLRPVDLGPSEDPDADPEERESSCVVEPLGMAPTVKVLRRNVAMDALRETLSEYGTALPASSTIPPGTRGVTLAQWAARWRLRTGDDYKDERVALAAFRKERQALLKAGTVTVSDPYVWIN